MPSILRCPVHLIELNYGCVCKVYHLTKLANFVLPPKNDRCPLCNKNIPIHALELSEEELWLESLSIRALTSKAQSRLIEIKIALKRALSLPDNKQHLLKNHRSRLKEFQSALEYLVLDGYYKRYFEFIDYNYDSPIVPHCINLLLLIYSEKYFPPLSYIASLRMFYTQREVENILLGDCRGL